MFCLFYRSGGSKIRSRVHEENARDSAQVGGYAWSGHCRFGFADRNSQVRHAKKPIINPAVYTSMTQKRNLVSRSGQVTAGVLRGERSRFQLFGDTVNMVRLIAARSSLNL